MNKADVMLLRQIETKVDAILHTLSQMQIPDSTPTLFLGNKVSYKDAVYLLSDKFSDNDFYDTLKSFADSGNLTPKQKDKIQSNLKMHFGKQYIIEE